MKKSKCCDSQILSVLKQAEGGTPITYLCCAPGVSNATFYKWRVNYGGTDAALLVRLK